MIVSDSTTLIILFDLKRLELLSNLFPKVIMPTAVYEEISIKNDIKLPNFMEVKVVKQNKTLEALEQLLDKGESEAIALALELNEALIIDEKKGRKIAMTQGIKIVGLLGIIYLNIKKNHITKDEAKSFLDDAVTHGYRIQNKLIDEMFKSLN